ncbi:MAG: hypothetical protein K2H09_07960 [Treponemataceae bacterium]|nr:hypothetical protein [Treponemataceae bacterium]
MLERDARDARVKGVADRFSGRVPAGILPKIAAVAEKLAAAGNCEFSDDGKSESVPALDMFSDILDGLASSAKNDVTEQRFRAEEFSDRESGGKDVDWNKLAANM